MARRGTGLHKLIVYMVEVVGAANLDKFESLLGNVGDRVGHRGSASEVVDR